MRIPLSYTNSLGETIDFEFDGFHAKHEELYSYKWDYTERLGRITSFRRTAQTRNIKVYINTWSDAEGIERRNLLHDVTEEDILRNTPGILRVGDYYCPAFIFASSKSNSHYTGWIMEADISVLLPDPTWRKDLKTTFRHKGHAAEEDWLNPPFNCAFNLAAAAVSEFASTTSLHPEDFRLEIEGFVEKPSIKIGANTYLVGITVNADEKLIVDSKLKTVELVRRDGSVTNAFDCIEYAAEGSGHYIFEKIPPGKHPVSWSRSFAFALTTYLTRSEPLWLI